MSIKGIGQELFVGKEEANILTLIGNKINIPYSSVKTINYRLAKPLCPGYVSFILDNGNDKKFQFGLNSNEPIIRAINFISEHAPNIKFNLYNDNIIDSFLDNFKLPEKTSARDAKENISNYREAISKVLYHDKFDEEYRSVNNYREITFNGRNFNIPEVQLCAAILLDGSEGGSKIRGSNHYALYFEGRYGIMNIGELHQWLYEKGYLRNASLWEALSLYKVPELKMMLDSIGLKKTGNKDILIDRIIDNIDSEQKAMIMNKCQYVFLSEKGASFLDENGDYARWHRKSYGVTFEEFNKHRILQGRKREFYDTIFQALNEKAFTYQCRQWFSRLEMIYFNLSEVLYDEGRYDLALQNTLFRLYFSTNLASHTYYFNIDHVKYDGIKKIKEHIIACNDVFIDSDLKRIVELKEYYSEHILDVVYGYHILPYTIFTKSDLASVIHDLLNGFYFDTKDYMNRICVKYEKYIKQFI